MKPETREYVLMIVGGTYRTFFDFGGVIGPILYSSLLTLVAPPFGYVAAFYVGAATLVLNLLLVLQIRRGPNPRI